ncbi:MAG: hypothetical protein M9923_09575, partial [Phycicoccus sp.]|uniref:hypothetical protein n=1 Tax=Phycicoccus sp. TaxID=1902410 RepID=UPI00258D91CF
RAHRAAESTSASLRSVCLGVHRDRWSEIWAKIGVMAWKLLNVHRLSVVALTIRLPDCLPKDTQMYTQPLLVIPPDIELGLLDGTLRLFGSVVRDSDSGQIVKHLKNAVPSQDQVEQAVRKLNTKIAVPVVAATVVLGGAAAYLVTKRRDRAAHLGAESSPACVAEFESSLRDYVEAGRSGALTADIVDRLIKDLAELKALSDSGGDVKMSLDELVPLFDLVIAHTPRLAEAYDVDLQPMADPDDESSDGVVVSLRRHLEAQKTILTDAA